MLVFSEGACPARAVLLDVLGGKALRIRRLISSRTLARPRRCRDPGARSSSPGILAREAPRVRKARAALASSPPAAPMALPPPRPRGRGWRGEWKPLPWSLDRSPGSTPPPTSGPPPLQAPSHPRETSALPAGSRSTCAPGGSREDPLQAQVPVGLAGGAGGEGGGGGSRARVAAEVLRAGDRPPARPPGQPRPQVDLEGKREEREVGLQGESEGHAGPHGGARGEDPPGGAATRSPRVGTAAQGWLSSAVWWNWGPCYSKGIGQVFLLRRKPRYRHHMVMLPGKQNPTRKDSKPCALLCTPGVSVPLIKSSYEKYIKINCFYIFIIFRMILGHKP